MDWGPGAVDPGERGVLTDRTTADCGGVRPNITYVERAYGMDGLIQLDRSVAGLTSF